MYLSTNLGLFIFYVWSTNLSNAVGIKRDFTLEECVPLCIRERLGDCPEIRGGSATAKFDYRWTFGYYREDKKMFPYRSADKEVGEAEALYARAFSLSQVLVTAPKPRMRGYTNATTFVFNFALKPKSLVEGDPITYVYMAIAKNKTTLCQMKRELDFYNRLFDITLSAQVPFAL